MSYYKLQETSEVLCRNFMIKTHIKEVGVFFLPGNAVNSSKNNVAPPQEMAKQSVTLQSDSIGFNTFKLEKLVSDLENKPPTFIEWMGVPHLDLDPEYLSRVLEDNTQFSVNYPQISQGKF